MLDANRSNRAIFGVYAKGSCTRETALTSPEGPAGGTYHQEPVCSDDGVLDMFKEPKSLFISVLRGRREATFHDV
ncbi:hypothetical protein EVG20_g4756 [Dentipellis fragilis]|uniref:Uncharacterized protein n=1 Tax=Dentipellis fragilis TaxID=205917 RepID=A0A4Y9YX93_9AGAM|nr:hypothetical protein EVG20_g4756 [Dentipellis fragilis]